MVTSSKDTIRKKTYNVLSTYEKETALHVFGASFFIFTFFLVLGGHSSDVKKHVKRSWKKAGFLEPSITMYCDVACRVVVIDRKPATANGTVLPHIF